MEIVAKWKAIGKQTKANSIREALFHDTGMFLIFLTVVSFIYLIICIVHPSLLFSAMGWGGVLKISGVAGMAFLLSSLLSSIEPEDHGSA